jgi:hypothetical protein
MKRSEQELSVFSYLTVVKGTATFANATDIITSNGHGLNNGDIVQFTNSGGGLPAGISALTNYFVIKVTTDTFQISAAPASSTAINFTTDGTGTNSLNLKGKTIECEEFAHLVVSYNTANSANCTIKFQGSLQSDVNFHVAQSATNRWDYVRVIDLNDGTSISGDTGVALTGTDDNRLFEINVNGLRSVCIAVTAWSAGTINATVKRFAMDNIL